MDWMSLIVAIIICVSISLLTSCGLRRSKPPPGTKLPPMPPTSSTIGHLELKDPKFHSRKAPEWVKKYGPVFRLRMFFTDIVVVNDIDLIKKFCLDNQTLHRPDITNFGRDYYQGITTMNGKAWQDNKRFCMSRLRDLGFGRSSVERRMADRFSKVAEAVDKADGKPLHLGQLFMEWSADNIASFFMGPWNESNSDLHDQLMDILKRSFLALKSAGITQYWPRLLRSIFQLIPGTRCYKISSVFRELENFIIEQIKNSVAMDGETSFVEEYTKMIPQSSSNESGSYQYRYLVGNIRAFMLGGIFGPSISMHLILVIFAARQSDIQRRVQSEIDALMSHGRMPTWEDRKHMPFTLACVWELERWKSDSLGLPRGTETDLVVDGFFVPKGTIVLFNLWAVNRDPSLWKDPHHFNPSRFLQEDGSLVPHKPNYYVAFSFGKRSCPGEAFASMETFLMLTFLLQKYSIHLDERLPYDLDDPAIRIGELQTTKLRFERRSN